MVLLAPSCGGGGGGGGGGGSTLTAPRWEETYRRPTSVDLRAVRFGDSVSGIVAGKYGTFVRTDDGGNTWRDLESTPVALYGDVLAMAVANITTFAVGGAPAGGPYTAGMAWQSLDANTFVPPDNPQIVFSEPWVDVVLTAPASFTTPASTLRLRPSGLIDVCQGSLLATEDSKINDSSISPPPPAVIWTSANGLSVVNVNYWLVCGNSAGAAQIRRTSNGGAFFDSLTISPTTTKPLHRIGMFSTTQGYAVGDSGTVLAVAPDPGTPPRPLGEYWTNLPQNPGIAQNLYALFFLDPTTGWVAGAGGTVYRIQNATSATPIWQSQATNTAQDLYDIYFADPDHGFAVGNNGTVVRTTNGTAATPTWTNLTTPAANPTPVFNAVSFTASGSIGLAVGNAGTLVRSLDAGGTWSPFSTGVGAVNLTAVSIPRSGSNTVAFVGTDTGAVFFNSNISGAGTWQAAGTVTAPALSGIKALLFPKDDTAGIATGVGGTFAKLTYSAAGSGSLTVTGATLSPAPGGTNYAAACDPTGNTLYIGGDGGYLVKSIDGGTTWANVPSTGGTAPAGSIRALQAPTGPNYTLFAGVDDNIVHSLSSTGTWAGTAVTGFGTPASMAFTSDLNGWVLSQGATGGIRYTTTGGAFWLASIPHVPVDSPAHALNAIWMNPSGFGVIVGANGLIMRTTTGGQ